MTSGRAHGLGAKAPELLPRSIQRGGAEALNAFSAPSSAVLLEGEGLKACVVGRTLWQGVHLQLRAGESVAVTGPSGVGKTVFLRVLAGLRPADGGVVCFAGRSLEAWTMPQYRAQVMYVSQRPVFPEGTVAAALRAPFSLRVHRGRSWPEQTVRQVLHALSMSGTFLDQATADLSGGQAQVAALVRALALEPSVLLLDEPTAALDPERTQRVEALLASWLQARPARACVWVSHDAAQVARVASRVLELAA